MNYFNYSILFIINLIVMFAEIAFFGSFWDEFSDPLDDALMN